MVYTTVADDLLYVKAELKLMGFSGKCLRDLVSVVDNAEKLEQLKNYIIIHDGEWQSSIELTHKYLLHLQREESYNSEREFITDYLKSVNKHSVYKKLFMCEVNHISLVKIAKMISEGLSLNDLYRSVVKYRTDYNARAILNMIEIDQEHKTKKKII